MKVGSLVECIDNSAFSDRIELNTPYLVEEFIPKGEIFATIPEGIFIAAEDGLILNGVNHSRKVKNSNSTFECPFPAHLFRELLPPIDIEAAISKTEPLELA